MPKIKQQSHCLTRKNSVCGSSLKVKCSALRRHKMLCPRRKRKRKVGVTLITALKKKQPPVDLFVDEAFIGTALKQKRNALMHTVCENSDKPHSDVKRLSDAYRTTDYNTPDSVARCQNDEADSRAETTISSCVVPIIIDDSSDADCSSVADTTNVYNTSAVSDACNSEMVDYVAEDGSGRITCGLG